MNLSSLTANKEVLARQDVKIQSAKMCAITQIFSKKRSRVQKNYQVHHHGIHRSYDLPIICVATVSISTCRVALNSFSDIFKVETNRSLVSYPIANVPTSCERVLQDRVVVGGDYSSTVFAASAQTRRLQLHAGQTS